MDDLISRQDVIDMIMGDGIYCDTDDDKKYSAERIMALPTAEPKKGKWLPLADGWACCSECEHLERAAGLRWRYCPNCGAKMEE